jgi:dTDP-4-amino-4,6-dideoxygalactose transaminase
MTEEIVFNRPHATGQELDYIRQAIANGRLSGDGPFTARCARWLRERTGCAEALVTNSGTSALELAVLLAGLEPGDEVIMPSFTFVSGANAVVLRGGVPVFSEIRADTLSLDAALIEEAVTARTKAIMPTHYAGVTCDMDVILAVASRHRLLVIEDAAQGLMSSHRGRWLGSLGDMGCVSFHETKNVTCGEGGALLVADTGRVSRAEIAYEKGTDRRRFMRGHVSEYTWVDIGSSFVASELNAAFLWAQLEQADRITARRLELWRGYHARFAELEASERLRRPVLPPESVHNAHMYYLLLPDRATRDALIETLAGRGIMAVFHYVPLHSSPAGRRFGRAHGDLTLTDDASARLVRLPLWVDMGDDDVDRVAAEVAAALR